MLYTYATFPGDLIITVSEIIPDKSAENGEKILVNFEQPVDYGFKEARYSLPDFKEVFNENFSPSETKANLSILKNNYDLLFDCARKKGKVFD